MRLNLASTILRVVSKEVAFNGLRAKDKFRALVAFYDPLLSTNSPLTDLMQNTSQSTKCRGTGTKISLIQVDEYTLDPSQKGTQVMQLSQFFIIFPGSLSHRA